jgi:SAM-dependent methyltransferase
VVAIDREEGVIADVGQRYPALEVVCQDIAAWEDPDEFANRFDTLILSSVLHEVESDYGIRGCERVLEACRRMLKPGGRLILRDGVKPEPSATVSIRIKTTYARQKLDRFALEFRGRLIETPVDESGEGDIHLSPYDLHDFLCKYYFEGEMWTRDMLEVFGNLDRRGYEDLAKRYFSIRHVETYTAPYLGVLWERDFDLPDGLPHSHILLVAEKQR